MLTAPRPQVVVLGLLVIGVLWAMYAVEKAERQTLQRSDEAKARQDPNHRAKKLEAAVSERLAAWKRKIERRALEGGKR